MPKLKSSTAFAKYPQSCDFDGRRVLNLGCGFAKYMSPNVVNLDAYDNCKPDMAHDLSRTPLPFKDGEFDFILANHIFEHVLNWWACFEECARILRPGGTMEIWVPGPGNDSVLGYRDHLNTINLCSWYGIKNTGRNPANAWAAANCGGYAKDLSLTSHIYHMERLWWLTLLPDALKKWCVVYLRNVVFEVGFFFQKGRKSENKNEA